MNIVIICYVFPPEHAPGGVMVQELAEDLAAAGHRVTVLTGWPNHPAGVLFKGWRARFRHVEVHPGGYRVVRCGHSIRPRRRILLRTWYYLSFALSTLVNGLSLGRIDAVYDDSTPIFGGWSGWLLARLKRARHVYNISDLYPESALNAGLMKAGPAYRALRALDSRLCRRSDAVTTLSEPLRRLIVERGVEASKVRVIPFWLDPEKIRPGERDNPWRRSQGIPADKFVAMYAGTIGYISGAEILIDAAVALKVRQDILLLIVGEGPVKDRLQARASELHLPNVRFLPFQPAEALTDVQATADVGLVTLLPEAGGTSVPSKVLGYLAAGRCVIAAVREDSPTARMIREGDCGIVTPSQDAKALAEAIRRAADDREMTRRLADNARRHFLATYSRQNCTRLYERVLTGRA